jgi:hypothetical protein
MPIIRPTLLALTMALPLGTAALPAFGLGIPLDLPRLDFPTGDGTAVTRGCTTATAPCAPVSR